MTDRDAGASCQVAPPVRSGLDVLTFPTPLMFDLDYGRLPSDSRMQAKFVPEQSSFPRALRVYKGGQHPSEVQSRRYGESPGQFLP